MSSQHAALPALPWARAHNTFGQGAVWAPEPVWTLWKRENCLLLPGIETRFVGGPVHCLAYVLNEISWHFCVFTFAESTIWPLLLAPHATAQVSTRHVVFGCVRIPGKRYYIDVCPFVRTKLMHDSPWVILREFVENAQILLERGQESYAHYLKNFTHFPAHLQRK